MLLDTLSYIGSKLNGENITWAVGASILLNHYGLVDKPNDIDIMVHIKDIEKADKVLTSLGKKKIQEKVSTYDTEYFYEYVVNGIDVDVMAGMVINHEEGSYKYKFNNEAITSKKIINGIEIPLTSLEDWYVLYQVIPNRKVKVKLIEDYMLNNGVKNTDLLKRALEGCLPIEVRNRIENFIIL
ncbi:nucleotidyltransferase family protein [Clostridium tunisiense]|uniref:nucleotidyltransferase family protein n=1 Tax=Clostridium tunisiense TaxID=219748 RepID=UPI0002F30A2C|nr:nucleotidyltransferase family protein [Clostridium tunisiense]